MRMTTKQTKILSTLCDGNPDGSDVDLDQLIDRLENVHTWETTKASLQFSLRRLIMHGLVVKQDREIRRGKRRAVLAVTELGFKVMGRVVPTGKVLPGASVPVAA